MRLENPGYEQFKPEPECGARGDCLLAKACMHQCVSITDTEVEAIQLETPANKPILDDSSQYPRYIEDI